MALLLFAAALSKSIYPEHGQTFEAYRLPESLSTAIPLLECLLVVLLLSRVWQRQMMGIAFMLFVAFAGISLYRGLMGAESCGCFGAVRVSPWIMFAVDVGIVAALCVARPVASRSSDLSAPRLATAFGAYAVVLVPLVAWLHAQSMQVAADGSFGHEGELVVLEPEGWLGKPFALLQYIDADAEFDRGDWVVVLHRHDCPKCVEAVPGYVALADKYFANSSKRSIALVEVPPFGSVRHDEESRLAHGRLRDDREWFVETPLEIRLQDGVVQRVSHELPALAELTEGGQAHFAPRTPQNEPVPIAFDP